jgi:glucose/arabinose dehydrogenase
MGGAPKGHQTRTLVIDEATSTLYVSVGSGSNIDPDSYRSRIRRFSVANASTFPLDFQEGEVFADGIRNEVALEWDRDGILWGAMNAGDRLYDPDLGGEIYNDNPAEELHCFATAGQNYGYPYCWREYNLPLGLGRGTAWAWPNASLLSKVVSDEECRTNYNTPALAMQAHSAPLGMAFYQYSDNRAAACEGVLPFPQSMDGYLFIAFHGSWNREIPTGYKVVYVPINGTEVVGGIAANPVDLLFHNGTNANWTDGFRPVDASFDACGRLLISSDGSHHKKDDSYSGDYVVRIESTQAVTKSPSTPSPPSTLPSVVPYFIPTEVPNTGGVPLSTASPTNTTFEPSSSLPVTASPSRAPASSPIQPPLVPQAVPSLSVPSMNSTRSGETMDGKGWLKLQIATSLLVVFAAS